jgi:YidC/Oxa1 family membrane protein insertase
MEQRNLLLAIVLSVGILIGFQFLLEKFHPVTPVPAPSQTTPSQTTPGQTTPTQTAGAPATPVPGSATAPAPAPAPTAATREQAIAEQPRMRINTPRLHGSIALVGGRIDDLTLATYHETPDPKSPEVVLLWPTGTKEPYFAQFGWVANGGDAVKVPGADTRWVVSGGPLRPNSR